MQFGAPAASTPHEPLQKPVHIDVHGTGLEDPGDRSLGAEHADQLAASGRVEAMDLHPVSLGGGRLLLQHVALGIPGDPQQTAGRQQFMVGETVGRLDQERAAGRGQRADHRGARGLGVQGGGPPGGVGARVCLPLDHDDRGVLSQMPGRGRTRDPGTDHNHPHRTSLPRPPTDIGNRPPKLKLRPILGVQYPMRRQYWWGAGAWRSRRTGISGPD